MSYIESIGDGEPHDACTQMVPADDSEDGRE